MWHNRIGCISAVLGHRVNPQPGTMSSGSGIAATVAQVATAAWIWSLAWELLHMLWDCQKGKRKEKKKKSHPWLSFLRCPARLSNLWDYAHHLSTQWILKLNFCIASNNGLNLQLSQILSVVTGKCRRQDSKVEEPELTSSHRNNKITTNCQTTIDKKDWNLPKKIFYIQRRSNNEIVGWCFHDVIKSHTCHVGDPQTIK